MRLLDCHVKLQSTVPLSQSWWAGCDVCVCACVCVCGGRVCVRETIQWVWGGGVCVREPIQCVCVCVYESVCVWCLCERTHPVSVCVWCLCERPHPGGVCVLCVCVCAGVWVCGCVCAGDI